MPFRFHILILVAFLGLKLMSQERKNILDSNQLKFEEFTSKDGLKHHSITEVYQDSKGYMWFGTYNGIYKYDGYTFKIYKNSLQNKYFWVLSGFFIHIPFWTSIFLILNYEGYFLENLGLDFSSRYTLVLLITLGALMDTLAYFGGKKYGKRKFLSNISPNKTLEGFLIALIGTPLLVMPVLALFFEYNFIKFFILIFLVSIFAVLGDAAASLFKRVAGVKDSSNLLPGHGGILDRIDSHLAAAPCFVVLVFLMSMGS